MKSIASLIFFAIVLGLVGVANVQGQINNACQNIALPNGSYIMLNQSNWYELTSNSPNLTQFNPWTGVPEYGRTWSISLCNQTIAGWDFMCPWAYLSQGTPQSWVSDCTYGAQTVLESITYDPVSQNTHFQYRSWDDNNPYSDAWNQSIVKCSCSTQWGSGLNVPSQSYTMQPSYSRPNSFDFTFYVSSGACCAKGGNPVPPHNKTRCKRIVVPDGQAVVPLDNAAYLSGYFPQARQYGPSQGQFGGYFNINMSLCQPFSAYDPYYGWREEFIAEVPIGKANIRLNKMSRDPYMNSNRNIVFSYTGSADGFDYEATVVGHCNPSSTSLYLGDQQSYFVNQTPSYKFQVYFDVYGAAFCPIPTATYLESRYGIKPKTGFLDGLVQRFVKMFNIFFN